MRLEIYRTRVLHETGTTQGYTCMVCYPAAMTSAAPQKKIRITIDGRIALTVEMAAARVGVTPKSLSGELSRYKIEHDGELDGKKKLYLQGKFDAWWKSRPGKAWAARKSPGDDADLA